MVLRKATIEDFMGYTPIQVDDSAPVRVKIDRLQQEFGAKKFIKP